MSDDKLITIANVPTAGAADVICAALDAEGIRAFAADAEVATMNWALTSAVGGVKVQVTEKDAARARKILEQSHQQDWEELDDAPDEPEPTLSKRDDAARRALRAAVFGIAFFPIQFYGLWLLWNAAWLPGKLDPKSRRSLWLASLLLTPLMSALVLIPIWSFFAASSHSGPPSAASARPGASMIRRRDYASVVTQDVRAIIAELMNLQVTDIKPDSTLESLGADELDFVELTMELEDFYGIVIDDEQLNHAAGPANSRDRFKRLTVRDLARLVVAAPARPR